MGAAAPIFYHFRGRENPCFSNWEQHYLHERSVYNEQRAAIFRGGAMRFISITHDVGHAFAKRHRPAVLQLCDHAAFHAVDDMAFFTPVIGFIRGTIYHSANTDLTQLYHLPHGMTTFAFMPFFRHACPVNGLKRMGRNDHEKMCGYANESQIKGLTGFRR